MSAERLPVFDDVTILREGGSLSVVGGERLSDLSPDQARLLAKCLEVAADEAIDVEEDGVSKAVELAGPQLVESSEGRR